MAKWVDSAMRLNPEWSGSGPPAVQVPAVQVGAEVGQDVAQVVVVVPESQVVLPLEEELLLDELDDELLLDELEELLLDELLLDELFPLDDELLLLDDELEDDELLLEEELLLEDNELLLEDELLLEEALPPDTDKAVTVGRPLPDPQKPKVAVPPFAAIDAL